MENEKGLYRIFPKIQYFGIDDKDMLAISVYDCVAAVGIIHNCTVFMWKYFNGSISFPCWKVFLRNVFKP